MSPEPQASDQPIDISIEKMVYGGEGLSRTAEGVLLTPGVIAGERARVIPEPARRGVRRGQLVEIAETSADRVEAECPHYARCGGCQYQHISYSRQLEIKQQILAECFVRVGKMQLEVPIHMLASNPWHYRNRIRLQIEKQATTLRIGYLAPASHELVPVDCCPISLPGLEGVVAELSRGALADPFPDGTAELELFSSGSGLSMLATVYSPAPAPAAFGDAWRQRLPQFESVCWSVIPSRGRAAAGNLSERLHDTVWGTGAIIYRAGDLHYRVSHHSFFQANDGLLLPMIEAAVGGLSGGHAMDLYAGVGFFTVPLSRHFERVAAVEAHPASAADLATNAGVGGTRVQVHHKTAEKFLATTSHNWDVILVDPPRSGLAKPVVEALGRLRAPRLVYVSCDPTTLARDVANLRGSGYSITSAHLVDQFPQTFHIETIVHLSRSA